MGSIGAKLDVYFNLSGGESSDKGKGIVPEDQYSSGKRATDIKLCEVPVGIPGDECPSGHRGGCHGLEGSFKS
ncbi:Uncharacterized protein TCM_004197 [Theobroma cacao]|uniref:Uncharacterized protein n=1 Tax=Theobroma cacao TaxID=3641 RepID=A0A061DQ68_THECC|nr:Uncharacterized protein TCM_004197 [Theobroma cacao]